MYRAFIHQKLSGVEGKPQTIDLACTQNVTSERNCCPFPEPEIRFIRTTSMLERIFWTLSSFVFE
jgi:hypothetical protein